MRLLDLFRKKSSGDVAKDRLKLLLVSDRANCSPDLMEMIKNDMIQAVSKYVEIDAGGMDIHMTQTRTENRSGTIPVLYASFPIRGMRYKLINR